MCSHLELTIPTPPLNILIPFGTTVVLLTDITVTEYANTIVVSPSLFKSQLADEIRRPRDPDTKDMLKLSLATRPPTGFIANETWRHCGMQSRQVYRLSEDWQEAESGKPNECIYNIAHSHGGACQLH